MGSVTISPPNFRRPETAQPSILAATVRLARSSPPRIAIPKNGLVAACVIIEAAELLLVLEGIEVLDRRILGDELFVQALVQIAVEGGASSASSAGNALVVYWQNEAYRWESTGSVSARQFSCGVQSAGPAQMARPVVAHWVAATQPIELTYLPKRFARSVDSTQHDSPALQSRAEPHR